MVPQVPKEKWKALFQQATAFRDARPWEWMFEASLFGIVDPHSERVGYAVFMGHLGEHMGLGLYMGAEGLKSHQETIRLAELGDHSEFLFVQDCLQASFEDREYIDQEDHQLIRSLGLSFQGKSAWPKFRSFRPGYYPWVLEEWEVDLLTVALAKALELAFEYRENAALAEALQKESSELLHLVPQEQDGVLTWQQEWRAPENTLTFRPNRVVPDKQKAKALAAELPLKEAYWLLEPMYLPTPVADDEGGRPYFPKAIMVMDLESGRILGLEACKADRLIHEAQDQLARTFRQAGFRPENILVSNKENFLLFRDLCKALGLGIHLDESIDFIPEVKKNLFDEMK